MELKKANSEVERIENSIDYWLSIKELELEKYEIYHIYTDDEYKKIINAISLEIDKLYEEKEKLVLFIDNELKKIKKYDEVLQEIINLKEIDLNDYSWQYISQSVHYSETQCRRLYSKYKKKRDI